MSTPTPGTDLVTTKANGLKGLLEAAKKDIGAALPKHITADRMVRIATTEFRKTPKLLECTPVSFLGAVIQAAQLGLEPGGALGHCYLIPYGKEVQFIVGYRGMLDLAMRSDKVSHIAARAVHEGDEFEWELGLNEDLKHKPCSEPGELTHVYCVVHLKNGCKMFDVMSRAEVEKVRKNSKAGNNGPWVSHFEEMAKKTVIRRLFKYMPLSIEIQRAVGLDEQAETDEGQKNGSVVETTSRPVSGASEELSAKLFAQLNSSNSEVELEQQPGKTQNGTNNGVQAE